MSETKQYLTHYAWNFLAHFGAGCYALANVILYFNAGNNFPTSWLDHRLTDNQKTWEPAAVTFLGISSAFLFTVNYWSYLQRIKKSHSHNNITHNDTEEQNFAQRYLQKYPHFSKMLSFTAIYWSVVYKTFITGCSLLTLTQRIFFFFGRYAIIPALICLLLVSPGNFLAQFALLSEQTNIKISNGIRRKISGHKMAVVLTACYMLSQAALYFDSPDEFFQHVYIATNGHLFFNYRLSSFKNVGAGFGVVIIAILDLIFSYSNQTSYQSRIEKSIKPDQEASLSLTTSANTSVQNSFTDRTSLLGHRPKQRDKPDESNVTRWVHRSIAITSSCYKSLVACSSFFAFILGVVWPRQDLSITTLFIAVILFLGNVVSQYPVFMEDREHEKEPELGGISHSV